MPCKGVLVCSLELERYCIVPSTGSSGIISNISGDYAYGSEAHNLQVSDNFSLYLESDNLLIFCMEKGRNRELGSFPDALLNRQRQKTLLTVLGASTH